MTKLFHVDLGGKARAILTVLTAVAAVLATPEIANWPWVAPISASVLALIQIVTRFTTVGDAKSE